jgi:protein required for attachment to host cells
MATWNIVVADGSRARLLRAELLPGTSAARLKERELLLSPERGLRGRDTFSNLKTGRHRAPPRFAAHGYDDHRLRHRDEIERRFARRIADATAKLVGRDPSGPLVIVAEPRLLGMLRRPLADRLPETIARIEIAEDLSWHALGRIRHVLEKRHVLPKGRPSPDAWQPRGQPPPLPPGRVSPARLPARRETPRPRRSRAKRR